jgi:hypothetical protein
MTNQDRIGFIRQKCIEVNPEIAELKFGCEVISGKTQFRILVIKDGVGLAELNDGMLMDFTRSTIFDVVLGRPLRLADVLLAVKASESYGHYIPSVDCEGFFRTEMGVVIGDEEKGDLRWNLRADDLEKQPEGTISFLYELLS